MSKTFYLPQGQVDALRELSERTRVPVSVYIREGVELVLAKHGMEGEE